MRDGRDAQLRHQIRSTSVVVSNHNPARAPFLSVLRLQLRQAQHDDSSAACFSFSTARGYLTSSPLRVSDRQCHVAPRPAPIILLVPAFACGTRVEERIKPAATEERGSPCLSELSSLRVSRSTRQRRQRRRASGFDRTDLRGGTSPSEPGPHTQGSFCAPCKPNDFAHEFAAAVRSALAAAMPSFVGLRQALPPLQQSAGRYHKNLSSRSCRPPRRDKHGQRRVDGRPASNPLDDYGRNPIFPPAIGKLMMPGTELDEDSQPDYANLPRSLDEPVALSERSPDQQKSS
ncbi:uncharacterized protein PAN0_002d1219 [Moesziomyces antarcticus]|uniref:Uncharacterized protein n=1 Tax=Pseudozyma antarctica TaxID=84753 RepID=A0A5C3FH09_PSEA2|nr:uncharacterized protein PAN0_002d1219 [Moesziomyces antarcticus]GAK63017.1 hypothetical protein PAN0_002d1219 [Moesziomyces antarcticus]SPO43500.1 uncharacterized protein PSANT_01185 [Moesziomyces antarcticus]